jgi:hypothetical protein
MEINCIECNSENLKGNRNADTQLIEISCLDCGTKFARSLKGSLCTHCREELIEVEHVFAGAGKKWIKYCPKCARHRG